MSTPGGAVAPYATGAAPAQVVIPTAVSSAKSSATFALGEVLKTVIHNSRAFLTENDLDKAVSVVDDFVKTMVPGNEMSALVTGAERAAKEDVTQRVAPNMTAAVVTGPQLDYTKLAQAILAEQRRLTQGEGNS